MKQDEIIEMARQADVWVAGQEPYQSQLEAFAKLVYDRGWMNGYTSCDNDNKTLTSTLIAEAVGEEREACADNVETFFDPMWADHYDAGNQLAKMIRSRGEA